MKTILISLSFILSYFIGSSQNLRREPVEWTSPVVYKAKMLNFKTAEVNYECNDCEILEIKTITGVTGYFVVGIGKVEISGKNIAENVNKCMLRFNPSDLVTFIKTDKMEQITDDKFVKSSVKILKTTFKHCYHADMDAVIPDSGVYAANLFCDNLGEILASPNNGKMIIFNFTTGKKM